MAVEFHIITSHEFFRVGTHGELDWPQSLAVLSTLAKGFLERGTDLAILDVRDTQIDISETQVEGLVLVLKQVGFRYHHRLAILHQPRAGSGIFVRAARSHGFDMEHFDSYEKAVEWLSSSNEEDPDFDRETYQGPGEQKVE